MANLLSSKESATGVRTFSEVIATGVTGSPLLLPAGARGVGVALIPAGGASGKVQFTLSPVANVDAGTANWVDWPSGVVSAATLDGIKYAATALRAVSSSGNITLEVVA